MTIKATFLICSTWSLSMKEQDALDWKSSHRETQFPLNNAWRSPYEEEDQVYLHVWTGSLGGNAPKVFNKEMPLNYFLLQKGVLAK